MITLARATLPNRLKEGAHRVEYFKAMALYRISQALRGSNRQAKPHGLPDSSRAVARNSRLGG